MRLALYQPDQPGNVGSILRLCACLGVGVDIVEPCGFPFSDRSLKRAGMDYLELAELRRYKSFSDFQSAVPGRIILMTTKASVRINEARFMTTDTLLMGAESSGVPGTVHEAAAVRVRIPQVRGTRSLNIAVSAGIGLAEALRQTNGYPND